MCLQLNFVLCVFILVVLIYYNTVAAYMCSVHTHTQIMSVQVCANMYVLYACTYTVYMCHAYVVKGLDKVYGWTFML